MSKQALFAVEDLHVSVEGKEIVKGVSLIVYEGEKHALMGPNGSGKSSLAYALMGHPNYEVTDGRIFLLGQDIPEMAPDERSRLGLFLALGSGIAFARVEAGASRALADRDELERGEALLRAVPDRGAGELRVQLTERETVRLTSISCATARNGTSICRSTMRRNKPRSLSSTGSPTRACASAGSSRT